MNLKVFKKYIHERILKMKLNKSRKNFLIYKFCPGVLILFFIIFSVLTGLSFAINMDEMILLKNSGVAENIIVSKYMVQKVKQVLTLDDMLKLQKAGFSGVSINLMSSKTGVLQNPVNNSVIAPVKNVVVNPSGNTKTTVPQENITVIESENSVPVETTIYPDESVVIYRHEKYGHLEIKNRSLNNLSVFINKVNKSIKILKGTYSYANSLIRPGRSLTFRLPVGVYSLDISNYSSQNYIDISTVGAELIFDNTGGKKNFNFIYRVLGKVLDLPYYKHDKRKKHDNRKSHGKNSKRYDNWSRYKSW